MTTGITLAKIVVAFVLVGVVLGGLPLTGYMRDQGVWPFEPAPVVQPPAPPVPAAAAQPPRIRSPRAAGRVRVSGRAAASSVPIRSTKAKAPAKPKLKKKSNNRRDVAYQVYTVPAESVLAVLLRRPLDSARARLEDRVVAILRSSVKKDGLELIAAASTIHGTVLDVVPASRWQPRGRVVVAFTLIEDAATGNRLRITARPVIFEPADAVGSRRTVDVRVKAGELVYITLADPLLVPLPK